MGDTKTSGVESALKRGFKLSDFTVEPLAGIVSGPAGRVHVDPKVMDVLILLAHRAGEVVPREELLDKVWPGMIVSDDALSRCIYQLRRQLSQAGGSDRYKTLFETLPKRGYRLNSEAPIAVPETVNNATSRGSVRFASLRVAGSAALIVGVALVGTTLWIAEHTKLPDVPTTNAQAYDAYLRGNDYFKRPDRRVALPYAESLYRQATDLDPTFALAWVALARTNTDIYWHGIDRTPVRLGKAEQAIRRLSVLDSELPEAHLAKANYFLKGLHRYQDALTELALAEKSISRDPELFFLRAMAYRRLGDWDLAIEALDRSLEFDSRNILHLRQQHISYLFVRNYSQAERLLNRILELFPDDGTTYVDKVVLALCRDGDTTLARQYDETAPSASYDDGLAYTYTSWLAAIYDRDYERALRILDDSVEDPIFDGDLRNSSFGPKALFYARTHQLVGNYQKARQEYLSVVRVIEERPPGSVEEDLRTAVGRYLARAEAYAGLGQHVQALELVRQARALIPESEDALSSSAVQLASVIRVLVPAGYEEEALRELDGYLDKEAGHWSIEGLRADPRLEPIRNSSGFKNLQEKYKRS